MALKDQRVHRTTTWAAASEIVKGICAEYGVAHYHGTGDPTTKPCGVSTSMDALSGEGTGYNLNVYPQGNERAQTPVEVYSIYVGGAN
jgi:hypothetical protein